MNTEKTEGTAGAQPKAKATAQHAGNECGLCPTKPNTSVPSRARLASITLAHSNTRYVIGIIITIVIAVIIAFLWVSLSHGTVETQIKPDL